MQQTETPSVFRAWCVLVVQCFQRHWRVRQMGWVSLGLLGIVVTWVAVFTARGGWELAGQRARRSIITNKQEAQRLLPSNRYRTVGWMVDPEHSAPYEPDIVLIRPLRDHEMPNPLNPTEDALRSLVLAIPQTVMTSEKFLKDWGFMTYSRWVVHLVFMGFVLPLFTLSYASGAFGTDRESRSLVWLMTRAYPAKRYIYLAKFLGTSALVPRVRDRRLRGDLPGRWGTRPRGARPLLARRRDGDGRVRIAISSGRRDLPTPGCRRVGVRVLF